MFGRIQGFLRDGGFLYLLFCLLLLMKGNEIVAAMLVSWSSVQLNSLANRAMISLDLATVESRLELAADIAPHNPVVHRALGRLHLLQGNWSAAAQELEKVLAYTPSDELARFNLANAYDQMGAHQKAIEQYEILGRVGRLGSVGRERLISNYVELLYQNWREDDCSSETLSWLLRIFTVDPSNFFASAMWFISCARSERIEVSASLDALRFYQINPRNPWQMRAVSSLIPDLVEAGLWSLEDAETFLELLNWYGFTEEVKYVCMSLLEKYPEKALLYHHLALAYAREGMLSAALSNAEEAVRRSGPGSPEHRLLCRLHLQGNERAAIKCLRDYRQANPEDQWGVISLAALGEEPDTSLALQEKVARLLGLGSTDVRIGPNLVKDPGFEEDSSFWDWFAHTGLRGNVLYQQSLTLQDIDDSDAFNGKWSGRIKVIWVDQRRGNPLVVGLNSAPGNTVELETGACYVFSFFYESDTGIALIRNGCQS